MFDWLRRLDPEASGIAGMTRQFAQMLDDGRHIVDAASNAFLGTGDPVAIERDLFETDARINETERSIRRGVVVHGTVHGLADLPTCLVLMSIVKDAERIGDYAKNLYDLAVKTRKTRDDRFYGDLVDIKDRVSNVMRDARAAYDGQNADQAREILRTCDELMDRCDARVAELLVADPPSHQPVATALAYRYFKRVVAHTSNVVTSIVMPVDRLDYVDEPKVKPRG